MDQSTEIILILQIAFGAALAALSSVHAVPVLAHSRDALPQRPQISTPAAQHAYLTGQQMYNLCIQMMTQYNRTQGGAVAREAARLAAFDCSAVIM